MVLYGALVIEINKSQFIPSSRKGKLLCIHTMSTFLSGRGDGKMIKTNHYLWLSLIMYRVVNTMGSITGEGAILIQYFRAINWTKKQAVHTVEMDLGTVWLR